MKVASFPSVFISVSTWLPCFSVLMTNPAGVLKLSGETALVMASAVLASPYSSLIVASNVFALQLFSYKFVNGVYKGFNLVDGHLSACSHIVTAALSAVLL